MEKKKTQQFFKVPFDLLKNQKIIDSKLGHTGILLYSLMADQVSLSERPENIDRYSNKENGKVFILFSENRANQMLGLSKGTYYKYKKKLKELKLIDYSPQMVKAQGNSTPIYVTKLDEWIDKNGGTNQ